jgi:hypothetical protein
MKINEILIFEKNDYYFTNFIGAASMFSLDPSKGQSGKTENLDS